MEAHEREFEILEEIIGEETPGGLLQIPGIYEVLREHYNNAILEVLEAEEAEEAAESGACAERADRERAETE